MFIYILFIIQYFNSLCKPETIPFIKNIISNTQLSKNELLYMIPIY